MNAINNDSPLTLLNTEQIDELVNRRLPASLLDMLERRWYEDFHIQDCRVKSVRPGILDEETRFLEVLEVAVGANRSESLQLANMQNVLSSVRDGSHAIAYAITSDGEKVHLLLGVRRSIADSASGTDDYLKVLYRSLRSNYPGIVLSKSRDRHFEDVPFQQYKRDLLVPLYSNAHLGAITGIPSLHEHGTEADAFSQSIDRLVDALHGESYTILVLAQPIPESRLTELIARLRSISEEVHTLVLQSRSISRSQTESKSTSTQEGKQMSLGVGQLLSAVVGIGGSISSSFTDTIGTSAGLSASVTQERLDKTAQVCEEILEHSISRLQIGRNLGFWNTGVFISSPDLNTFRRAQGIARGLFSGESSYIEPIRLLDLGENRDVRKAIANLQIPELDALPAHADETISSKQHPLGKEYQSVSTPLTTSELSVLMNFPTREVPGLKLKPVADFNLNPPEIPQGVEIGSLLYRGEKLSQRIAISHKSLTRHTFITGLTGSGKTNTCLALLEDAYRKQGLNFLVIDPAKTEYRFLANSPTLGKDLMIFTLGDEHVSPFRLNPFEFVRGFSLLGHIDLIKAVFNAAFPMYASMPYLLEEAILEIYQERGWDIASSTNRLIQGDLQDPAVDYTPFLPRLSDLYAKIDKVVARKGYESKVSQDLTAALKARLGSLLHGGKGLMLDTQRSIDIDTFMKRPVLLELRHAGDEDERAFVMALIFTLLYEACQNRPMRDELVHVTLIEEAHRLLKNIPANVSLETSNPRGKAVEMFTDMMVEMRAHGEGFVVVDQMPSKLVPDVIKGSNLKIVHRLMAQDDRNAVGYAMGMKPDQIDYLPRLRQGEAVVHSEELEEACLVLIDSMENRLATTNTHTIDRTSSKELKIESEKFYHQSPQLLFKYPACSLCDSPCHYYVGEDARMLTPALVNLGNQFLGLVAVGSWQACQGVGARLQTEIRNRLHEHYGTNLAKGQERCFHILLASRCARNFAEAYSHAGHWDAVLQLQTSLAGILGSWPCTIGELSILRKLILGNIAISPASPMVGCSICPHRCWFGFFLQGRGSLLVNNLREQIHSSRGKQEITVERLSLLLAGHYGDRIDPHLRRYAAYCLLSQCTNDEALLLNFRREAASLKF